MRKPHLTMCGGYAVVEMTADQRNRFHEYALGVPEIRAYLMACDQLDRCIVAGIGDLVDARRVEIEASQLAYQVSKKWWEYEEARMKAEAEREEGQ